MWTGSSVGWFLGEDPFVIVQGGSRGSHQLGSKSRAGRALVCSGSAIVALDLGYTASLGEVEHPRMSEVCQWYISTTSSWNASHCGSIEAGRARRAEMHVIRSWLYWPFVVNTVRELDREKALMTLYSASPSKRAIEENDTGSCLELWIGVRWQPGCYKGLEWDVRRYCRTVTWIGCAPRYWHLWIHFRLRQKRWWYGDNLRQDFSHVGGTMALRLGLGVADTQV